MVIPTLVLNEDLLDQAKKAIQSTKTPNTELIIVDNGSTVGGDYFREVADIYVRYPDKIGFGAACNAGLKLARGKYLAIQSIDVEYKVGNLEDLAEQYSHIESVGVLCPSALNKGQTMEPTFFENQTEGSSFLFSREVYEAVRLSEGLYDERFVHGYYEDTDLWYRMDQLKLRLIRSGFVVMNHGQGTTNKYLGVLDKYMAENHDKFVAKWGEEPIWRG